MHQASRSILSCLLQIVVMYAPAQANDIVDTESRVALQRDNATSMHGLVVKAAGQFVEPCPTSQVLAEESPDRCVGVFVIEGSFDRPGWTLLFDGREVQNSVDLVAPVSFKKNVTLVSDEDVVIFQAVSPLGEVEEEKIIVKLHAEIITKPTYVIVPSLAVAYNQYRETGKADYFAITWNARIQSSRVLLLDRLDVSGDLSMTLVPMMRSDSNLIARFIDLNIKGIYYTSLVKAPWRLGMSFGWSYSGMIVRPAVLGYSLVSGPQLGMQLSRKLRTRSEIKFFAHYVPIMSGFGFASISDSALSVGSDWSYLNRSKKSFLVGVELSKLKFAVRQNQVMSTTALLSIGFGI